jgi:peptidoglycan/xylan/chitin deacetylase (PgdA/CDA1 family)
MSLFFFLFMSSALAQTIYYTDQKQNCAKNVKGNYCYNGPQFDAIGQYKSCSVPGTIAITFDDGPSVYTSHILDVLKEHNMKATFFIIGKYISSNHALIQRIVDEGHQIGSHTYSHTPLETSPNPLQEMLNWEIALVRENFTGLLANSAIPNYMRAPHGVLTTSTYNVVQGQLGYTPVHWGFLTQDSEQDTGGAPVIAESDVIPEYQSHLGGTSSGLGVNAPLLDLITQQHDSMQTTSDTFEDLTTYLDNTFTPQGVRFVTVADCLGGTVPAFRPNPRIQNDPTCANGIKKVVIGAGLNPSTVCCTSDCGKCGGDGCSLYINMTASPNGLLYLVDGASNSASLCCANNILSSSHSCKISTAPCVV